MPAPFDLGELYDAHAPALFAFLLNLTRREDEVRDLLQDLFVKLARQPELLVNVRAVRPFLLRMARNAAVDLVRRRQSGQRTCDRLAAEAVELFAPSADPDAASFRQALSAALGELPPEQREVVHLKLWEDLTFDQIAQVLEIPLNTAASRYRYGLDKLRERLRPVYDEIT